jgi:hypothetical protein
MPPQRTAQVGRRQVFDAQVAGGVDDEGFHSGRLKRMMIEAR